MKTGQRVLRLSVGIVTIGKHQASMKHNHGCDGHLGSFMPFSKLTSVCNKHRLRSSSWQYKSWPKVFEILNMNRLDYVYEPHLASREFSVSPGKEWLPRPSDWSLIQVESGMGYWLQAQSS